MFRAAFDVGLSAVGLLLTLPLMIPVALLVTVLKSFGINKEYERAVLFRLGRLGVMKGPGWYWNTLHLGEHTGTHFDAPVHWITGKDLPDNRCDTIPARRFVGPACVIDVTQDVAIYPDFLLTPERLLAWEADHGRIPAGAWVLLRTDWSKRSDPAEFLNIGEDGPHSPGFHKSASEFLARERDILGVGVETVGTDAGQAGGFDPPFPNHTIMHGAGKFGLASLKNLDKLPPTGAIVIAAPLKLVGGSGSPLRVLALTN